MLLPKCPFCGTKLSFIEAFVTKNKSIFKCRACKNRSIVSLSDFFYKVLFVTLFLLLAIFFVANFLGDNSLLLCISLIFILFFAFYCITPFTIKLEFPENISINSGMAKNIHSASNDFDDNETDIYSD